MDGYLIKLLHTIRVGKVTKSLCFRFDRPLLFSSKMSSTQVRELLKSSLSKRKATLEASVVKKVRIEEESPNEETELIARELELFEQEIREISAPKVTASPVAKRSEKELILSAMELNRNLEQEEQRALKHSFTILKSKRSQIPKQNARSRPQLWSKSEEDSE